jgi:hypothetical protein
VGALCWACAAARPLERSEALGDPAPLPGVAAVPTHGHDVEIQLAAGCAVTGELLATDSDYLWVRRAQKREVLGVPTVLVERVNIELYTSESAAIGGWTALGALTTPSHGGFLILSLPVWLLTGITTSSYAAAHNDTHAAPKDFPKLYEYARFPQGLPPAYRSGALGLTGCH